MVGRILCNIWLFNLQFWSLEKKKDFFFFFTVQSVTKMFENEWLLLKTVMSIFGVLFLGETVFKSLIFYFSEGKSWRKLGWDVRGP